MQLSVALWKSLVSDDLVAPLTKDIIQYIKLLLGVFTDY